nr:DEAD/DEAH box helicase [uncultured Peptostreptococcus sp.]
MTFADIGINIDIIKALEKSGIKQPTPVQNMSLSKILEGSNLIIESNTGTGKTLAFLIPLLNRICLGEINNILVLAPTRELVIQIFSAGQNIIDKLDKDISMLAIYGGRDIKAQIKKLNDNINIVVATPGRLLDHINRNSIDIKEFDCLVIDEADQMLLMGFKNEIDAIISNIKKYDQIIFSSATIDAKVKKLAYRYAKNLDIVSINKNQDIPDLIDQEFIKTSDRDKFNDFCKIIDRDKPFMAIVFCRTKARVDKLELQMGQAGYNCKKIHSDISQNKREKIMKDFRDLKIQFLISTDLSARGLDIEGLSHIYNYDFPERLEDYIHRVGRSGRLGKEGKAVSLLTEKNIPLYEDVKKL